MNDEQEAAGFLQNECPLCHIPRLICPKCDAASCSGSGCSYCLDTFVEFAKTA